MKTGTKHQNKNNRGEEGGEQKKKRKAVNTKRTKEEKTCWKGKKKKRKKKKACIFMPKPIEHNSTNQDSHLNQGCLSKYKNLERNLLKLKCQKSDQYICYRDINFINVKHYLISHLIL